MYAKKSFGQHFLTSRGAIAAIIGSANLDKKDIVLEIGPGRGVLTEALLEKVDRVITVEKDRELIPLLEQKFAAEIAAKKLILLNEDILEFELTDHYNLKPSPYKIVANIPYNITGAIIEKFLTIKNQPKLMTLLVQKEVAERVVAKDGKESILSLSVKAYGEPKYIQTVKAGSFNPAPKVDSAILQITSISRDKFTKSKVSEKQFFQTIKAGFAHKRKTIANNLKSLKLDETKIAACGAKPIDRAEDLDLDQWFCLATSTSPSK